MLLAIRQETRWRCKTTIERQFSLYARPHFRVELWNRNVQLKSLIGYHVISSTELKFVWVSRFTLRVEEANTVAVLTKGQLIELQSRLEREILSNDLFTLSHSQIIVALFCHAREHGHQWVKCLLRWLAGDDTQYQPHMLMPAGDILSFALWMLHHKVKPRRGMSLS